MTLFTAIKNWLHRLFGKTEEKTVQPVKTKKKLSRADKKQIEAAIARANRTDKKGKSAQDSIPYERMWPDGICRVSDSHYTKTIQFQDINYQLSQNEDKTAIFEGWCDFLNYFDSSIHFQLSFLNLAASEETFANSISIPPQGDAFDSIREEYTTMLQNQLARGNNGLIKTKYLTFGIDADSIKAAKRTSQTAGNTAQAASKTGKAARTVKEKAQQAGAFVMRHKKGFLIAGALFLIACMLMNTMSSCSMMAQSIGSVLSGTTYPSDDPEMLAVEADYVAREVQLQEEIDNIESNHPGYDEYRYDLGMIGHDPHELAAFLSAVLQGYTRQSAQAELARVFAAQYQLTLTEEVEIRYRTETSTDPETGETTSEEVPYEYYILNVKLTSKPISAVASELLTPEQMEMYQIYRQTMGNKPLLFGGGSPDTSGSEDLSGVQFINGTRPGNPQLVELAKSQVGNVGGYPYWSWYGFDSRVEWCACFVSWCYNQAGKSELRFAGCEWQGVPWFQSHGQWGARGYENIAPGDAIFFDWDLDGTADHVGIVVGTDGSRVYTVEGNSGDACKIKSYDLNYQSIKGYGLMNW